MLQDDKFERRLLQLKEAYDKQLPRTNVEELLVNISQGKGRTTMKKRRIRFPIFTGVAVIALIALLAIATPELFDGGKDELLSGEQGKSEREMASLSNDKAEGVVKESELARETEKLITLQIEGTPEDVTLRLATHDGLKISTYYPEGMIVETETNSWRFFASHDGEIERDAYVEVYGKNKENTTKVEMLAPFQDKLTKKEAVDFSNALSEEEYLYASNGVLGLVSLFERDGKLFRTVIHYPAEYGDGFSPRADVILSELTFH